MQQVCYIAAARDLEKLDNLFNELDIAPICYPIEQVKALTGFISREKTLNQQNFIIFNLMEASYSQEHILSAVQMLRKFSIAELIFISPDDEETTRLYGILVQAPLRVKRLITMRDGVNYVDAVRKMLTAKDEDIALQSRVEAMQNSMTLTAKELACPVKIPAGLVIDVAVAGTMRRVGTTTQSFALYHYLKSLGFKPAIQLADKEILSLLMGLYGATPQDSGNYVLIRDIPFCQKPCEAFDCYINDLSVISSHTAPSIAEADVSVLVTGVKPWELTELGSAMMLLQDCKPRRLLTIASFAGDQDLEALSDYLGENYVAAPYHPDFWSAGSTAAYQSSVLPLVKDYCGDYS